MNIWQEAAYKRFALINLAAGDLIIHPGSSPAAVKVTPPRLAIPHLYTQSIKIANGTKAIPRIPILPLNYTLRLDSERNHTIAFIDTCV